MALGMMVFLFSMSLNGFLALLLIRRKGWKGYPAFTAYVLFNAVHDLILLSLYGNHAWYLLVWEIGRPVTFALKIWIVGDILQTILTSSGNSSKQSAAYEEAVMVERSGRDASSAERPRNPLMRPPSPTINVLRVAALLPAPFLFHRNMNMEFWLGCVIAFLMGCMAFYGKFGAKEESIVWGLFVYSLFVAISALAVKIPHGSFIQFVPVFSYTVALSLWIHGFRQEAACR